MNERERLGKDILTKGRKSTHIYIYTYMYMCTLVFIFSSWTCI